MFSINSTIINGIWNENILDLFNSLKLIRHNFYFIALQFCKANRVGVIVNFMGKSSEKKLSHVTGV